MNLDRTILLVAGWHRSTAHAHGAAVETSDCWTGSLKDFWSNNEDMTFSEIREIDRMLADGEYVHVGGGATGCFTIISANASACDEKRAELDR